MPRFSGSGLFVGTVWMVSLCLPAVGAAASPDAGTQRDRASAEPSPDAGESEADKPSGDRADAVEPESTDRAAQDAPSETVDEKNRQSRCPDKSSIPDETTRDQFTLMGVACFKAKRFARAYTYYQRAYQESPSPLLTAAIGRTLHKLGIYHLAEDYYRKFLEGEASRDRETAASADKIRRRLDQLQTDIDEYGRKVRLTSIPSASKVSMTLDNGDWLVIGRTPANVTLKSGTYRFAFEHPDYRGRVRTIDLEGDSPPDEVETTLFHREAAFDASGETWRRRGFITSAASFPMLATSALLFGLSQSTYSSARNIDLNDASASDLHNEMVVRATRLRNWGIGTAVLGTTTLGVGVIMIIRGNQLTPDTAYEGPAWNSPHPSPSNSSNESARRPLFQPMLGPRGAAIRISW